MKYITAILFSALLMTSCTPKPSKADLLDQWGHERYTYNPPSGHHKHQHRHHRKPKVVYRRKVVPQVRAYVKREDEDRLICLDKVRVVGSQWATASGAEDSAQKAWMEQVRWRYGESAMTIDVAKGYAKRCSRSSIGEAVGAVLHRCEVEARPCRPVFESK